MPVYREGKHLANVLDAVALALSGVEVSYEFVLVDDGSPDIAASHRVDWRRS